MQDMIVQGICNAVCPDWASKDLYPPEHQLVQPPAAAIEPKIRGLVVGGI